MNKATIKQFTSMFFALIIVVVLGANVSAQNAFYGQNIVIDGDFSGETLPSAWVDETGANGTVNVTNGELAITGLQEVDNIYDAQVNQPFTADQIAALAAGGTFELSFNARTTVEAKNIHVFLGQVGGDWARYWAADGDGLLSITNTTQTYTLTHFVTETWEAMRLGFEVSSDTASIFIDNVQLRKVSDNIIKNGDFSVDSAWTFEGSAGDGAIVNGELAFTNLSGTGNIFDFQAFQLFDQAQLDSIRIGQPYELTFDARTSADTKNFHVFLGQVGGDWARWWQNPGDGLIEATNEMKTYTLNFGVTEATKWDAMRLGFEINSDTSSLWIDNVVLTRLTDVAPDKPTFSISSNNGINTVTVDDIGAASYEVYFADTAFTSIGGGSFVGEIDPTVGFSVTHTIAAPHPTLVENYTGYFGVIAKSAKGSSSEFTGGSVETETSVSENYIYHLTDDDATSLLTVLSTEGATVPDAATIASYFPDTYKPFTINENRLFLSTEALPDDDADLSAKFWIGYETFSGSDFMFIYAEITDDAFRFTPEEFIATTRGGQGWQYDSWELGIGAYEPASIITGSDHTVYELGDEPDYQWRGGLFSNGVGYMHGYDDMKGTLNGDIPNSSTLGDTTQPGVYRLLSNISTLGLSQINTTNADFVFPSGSDITTIPLALAVNDADDETRESQVNWSSKAAFGGWWNTPTAWEVVALVGRDAIFSVNNELEVNTPTSFTLEQNYPNPFNPSTNIQFTLPASSEVTLEIFNMLGQKVATLLQGENMKAGSYTQKFDASSLASGMYVYRISTPKFVQSRKMMLIK